MKPQLIDFRSPGEPGEFGEIHNVYSQFGEDGMIEHLFNNIGVLHQTCAEFGASDGLSGSNTASLWKQGWGSIQIEADAKRYVELVEHTAGYSNVITRNQYVTPENVNEVLSLIGPLDLVTIDVDSIDYLIFESMSVRPRVVLIEFNDFIPPHIAVRPVADAPAFQSSALALKRLAESKHYKVAGRTRVNLFLVAEEAGDPAEFYDTTWDRLFDWNEYTYSLHDPWGRASLITHRIGQRNVPLDVQPDDREWATD